MSVAQRGHHDGGATAHGSATRPPSIHLSPRAARAPAMHTIRIPAYAPLVVPMPPPPPVRRTSPVAIALAIIATTLGVGIYAVMCVVVLVAAVLAESDRMEPTLTAASAPTPTTPAVVAVDHEGDDCTTAALRDSHACEDMECFATIGAELRACLSRPEQEARVCSDLPDPSFTSASAQWMITRCSFESARDQNDCIRLMSIVQDHCANVGAQSQH